VYSHIAIKRRVCVSTHSTLSRPVYECCYWQCCCSCETFNWSVTGWHRDVALSPFAVNLLVSVVTPSVTTPKPGSTRSTYCCLLIISEAHVT